MNRVYQIDLLRFIAAISVMCFHYFFISGKDHIPSIDFDFGYLGDFTKFGFLGVHLFFMISGYVILMSCSQASLKSFIIARISRLYPAFWICATISSIYIYFFGLPDYKIGLFQYIVNLTMMSGFIGVPSIDGAYWSLFVEIRFYFLISLLLYFGQIKNIFNIIVIWMALTVVSRIILPVSIMTKGINFVFMTGFGPLFAAGMILYLIHQNGVRWKYFCLLMVTYYLCCRQINNESISMAEAYNTTFPVMYSNAIIMTFYAIFFLIVYGKLEFLNRQFFIYLGMITYPLYLLHQYIGYMVIKDFANDGNKFIVAFLLIVVIITVSFILANYIEKPFSKRLKGYLVKVVG